MKYSKYLFLIFFLILTILPVITLAAPIANEVPVYFFRGEGCPHCADEEVFLEKLQFENSNVTVYDFEVWYDRDNAELMEQVANKLKVRASGVPLTVIGEQTIVGFLNEETTGQRIRQAVEICQVRECVDIMEELGVKQENISEEEEVKNEALLGHEVDLPMFGTIDVGSVSLFGITSIIAFLDGFNPCAMWVLLFLISLLLGLESKKRRWLLGLSFIMASGVVYYLFLAAWLNVFLFIGAVVIIRIIIGLVAIGSGIYNLKSWYDHKTGCAVKDDEKKRKIFEKIKDIIGRKSLWLSLIGIVLLAAAVNMVELVCSAGLPAIYTQILSLSDLSTWQYYAYLVWYIIIFMADDALIFIIAMITVQAVGVSNKYALWNKLIGGLIILILGILLIFWPELLMFG